MATKLLLLFRNFYDHEEADRYEQMVCDGTSEAAEFLMKYGLRNLELGHELYNGDIAGWEHEYDNYGGAAIWADPLAREAYLKGVQVVHLLTATDAASSTGNRDGGCDVSSSYSNLESLVGKGPVEFVHKVTCNGYFSHEGDGYEGRCDLSRLLDGKPEAFLKQFIADAIAAGAKNTKTWEQERLLAAQQQQERLLAQHQQQRFLAQQQQTETTHDGEGNPKNDKKRKRDDDLDDHSDGDDDSSSSETGVNYSNAALFMGAK